MKLFSLTLFTFLTSSLLLAHCNPEKDRQSIKQMSGCFEVEFRFQEVFAEDSNYQYDTPYHEKVIEWVSLDEARHEKIAMQHILVIPGGNLIKHWREEWLHEKNSQFAYLGHNRFKRVHHPTPSHHGQWTQQITQVDDRPRYECQASWFHHDNTDRFTCTADAPLPRRETHRLQDYDIMQRTNTFSLNGAGYIQEEDNEKIQLTHDNDGRNLIVREKGRITYKRVPEEKCDAAKAFWQKNKDFYQVVRESWSEVLSSANDFTLLPKVEGKRLSQYFGEIQKESLTQAQLREKLVNIISSFVQEN